MSSSLALDSWAALLANHAECSLRAVEPLRLLAGIAKEAVNMVSTASVLIGL